METPSDLWRMRKQFTLQLAAACFMTHAFFLTSRLPNRFHVSRRTGQIAMSELLPGMGIPAALLNLPNQLPVFASHDVVPFRFTPNLQRFIGDCFTEGILISAMMAMGHALSEPQVKSSFEARCDCANNLWSERRWRPAVSLCQGRDDYLAASTE
jgi:transformation/transcription domain-associated protein